MRAWGWAVSALIIGVDPGLTTGVFAVEYDEGGALIGGRFAVQVHGSEGAVPTVQTFLGMRPLAEPLLAVEQFVVSARAAKSRTPQGGREARAIIAELGDLGVHVFTRNASIVKNWATDKRLEAAGFLDPTKRMAHARDAARHALYAAVRCGYTTDPLSMKVAIR
jgi:hypothetical protein